MLLRTHFHLILKDLPRAFPRVDPLLEGPCLSKSLCGVAISSKLTLPSLAHPSLAEHSFSYGGSFVTISTLWLSKSDAKKIPTIRKVTMKIKMRANGLRSTYKPQPHTGDLKTRASGLCPVHRMDLQFLLRDYWSQLTCSPAIAVSCAARDRPAGSCGGRTVTDIQGSDKNRDIWGSSCQCK